VEHIRIILDEVGEFIPNSDDAVMLEWLSEKQLGLTPKEYLVALFVLRCVQFAKNSVTHMPTDAHLSARDILSVGEVTGISVFGESARDWLRVLGLTSSLELGKAVYWLVRRGVLSIAQHDRISDFDVRSDYDAFMQETA
jgi:uncharacterized repeat protein (TIGR04138 family)